MAWPSVTCQAGASITWRQKSCLALYLQSHLWGPFAQRQIATASILPSPCALTCFNLPSASAHQRTLSATAKRDVQLLYVTSVILLAWSERVCKTKSQIIGLAFANGLSSEWFYTGSDFKNHQTYIAVFRNLRLPPLTYRNCETRYILNSKPCWGELLLTWGSQTIFVWGR